MRKLRVLDLYCGAGGAGMGYALAGFDVTGVDLDPQPRYPFAFHQGDALEFVREHGAEFDLIHASPPCQAHVALSLRWKGSGGLRDQRPELIAPTREALIDTGKPYVIENVPGAARTLRHPIVLTGEMFGLGVHRPRLFECSPFLLAPPKPARQKDAIAVYGKMDGRRLWSRKDGTELRAPKSLEEPAAAMGIDWMEWDELREAIPPAYTRWIGEQMLPMIRAAA